MQLKTPPSTEATADGMVEIYDTDGTTLLLRKSITLKPGYIYSLVKKTALLGDLNAEGKVDIFDYNLLVTNFGKIGSAGFIPADINKDRKIDSFDYNQLVGSFKK